MNHLDFLNSFETDFFDFEEVIKRGALIIDVRTNYEFLEGNIPGSINIPLSELFLNIDELESDYPVVIYCASGVRSVFAKKILKDNGFKEVYNAGGIIDLFRMIK